MKEFLYYTHISIRQAVSRQEAVILSEPLFEDAKILGHSLSFHLLLKVGLFGRITLKIGLDHLVDQVRDHISILVCYGLI